MTDPLLDSSDEQHIAATLAGDDRAYGILIARYKGRVFRLASRFTGDRDELDDLCQEVFIKAYEGLKSFRGETPFGHWLTRIAVNACYDFLRRKKHHATVPMDAAGLEIRDPASEARLAAEEARSILSWGMARLSPQERMVLTLMELEEKTVREIAALTGWSEGNVKVKAHRARQALKRILEEQHER